MDLFYGEQKPRSLFGCFVFLFVLLLGGCGGLLAVGDVIYGRWGQLVFTGAFAAFCLYLILRGVYHFIRNDFFRFGIRDDAIWWDL